MKKLLCSLFLALITVLPVGAQQADVSTNQSLPPQLYEPELYSTAVVEDIIKEGEEDIAGVKQKFQELKLKIASGKEHGKIVIVKHGGQVMIANNQLVDKGEKIILVKTLAENGQEGYYIADKYRLPWLFFAVVLFLSLAVYFGRVKGVMSIVGLAFSIVILLTFVVPSILSGTSPFLVTFVGSCLIATVSMLLAHGLSRRSLIAMVSTLLTLLIAILLAVLFVHLSQLFGGGSDEAVYLRLDPNLQVNLQGLLLGGIIIGTLGVLDDITTAQVAVVDELKKANASLSARELYARAISIGREHIASLVNTLVLAYAGASLPLFLMFTLPGAQPLWVTFNSEFIAEEVIRTLVGSSALILAVPLSTLMAVRYLARKS